MAATVEEMSPAQPKPPTVGRDRSPSRTCYVQFISESGELIFLSPDITSQSLCAVDSFNHILFSSSHSLIKWSIFNIFSRQYYFYRPSYSEDMASFLDTALLNQEGCDWLHCLLCQFLCITWATLKLAETPLSCGWTKSTCARWGTRMRKQQTCRNLHKFSQV